MARYLLTPHLRKVLVDLCEPRFAHYTNEEVQSISLEDVKLVSKVYRAQLVASKRSPAPSFVHKLLKGSKVWSPPKQRVVKTAEFEAYLTRMRAKADNRDYERAMADVAKKSKGVRFVGSDEDRASLRQDLGMGLNVITLMATGFFVFYYFGGRMNPGNQAVAVGFGVLGLFLAMLIEVLLFVIREEKLSIRSKKFGKKKSA